MSDKKTNLTDFFKKETKKKTAAKATTAAEDLAKQTAERDAQIQEQKQASKETKAKDKDYESSEEEKTDIFIGDDSTTLIQDKKDVEAQKRKLQQEQEENSATGWKALEKHSEEKPAFTTSNANVARGGPLGAQPKGAAGSSEIKFSKGPMTFKKGNKHNQKLDEDFPELGAESAKTEQKQAT